MKGLAVTLVFVLTVGVASAGMVTGFSAVTVDDSSDPGTVTLTDLTYNGVTYTSAQFIFGTTTRFYDSETGSTEVWTEGTGVPGNIVNVPGSSSPKAGDVGSHGDNALWLTEGDGPDISSLDALPYQETLFSSPVNVVFVFERGGNDDGTIIPILVGGGLGMPSTLTGPGDPYALIGNYSGQNDHGYVFVAM